jgi:hypothetical protein
MARAPKRRYIRLGWEAIPHDGYKVCDHVDLPLAKHVDGRSSEVRDCEYMIPMEINCRACDRNYALTILVG